MTPLVVNDDLRLLIEFGMFLIAAGGLVFAGIRISAQVGSAITRFELIGQHQERDIGEMKDAIRELKDTLALVAVQKDQIQSNREQLIQNTKRTDETFTRIFSILDDLRKTKPSH